MNIEIIITIDYFPYKIISLLKSLLRRDVSLIVDTVHNPSECLFVNIHVFDILSSKRDLNKRQSIHLVSVFNMSIYRYTYQARINKSKSARTDENLYYLFQKS